MPVKNATENTFDYSMKHERRWEIKYPDKKCVMVPDPDKFTGEDRTNALRVRSTYYNLPMGDRNLQYREIKLTDEERIALMDSDMNTLMACDRKEWQAARKFIANDTTPDETVDVVGGVF